MGTAQPAFTIMLARSRPWILHLTDPALFVLHVSMMPWVVWDRNRFAAAPQSQGNDPFLHFWRELGALIPSNL